jgi:membrane-associated phospholipid phosphatase
VAKPAVDQPAMPATDLTLPGAGMYVVPSRSEHRARLEGSMIAAQSPDYSPWPGPSLAAGFVAANDSKMTCHNGAEPWGAGTFEPGFCDLPCGAPISPILPVTEQPLTCLGGESCFLRWWREEQAHVIADHCNFYSTRTLVEVGVALALAAPLANTSLDADFANWYQRDVRSSGTDHAAAIVKPLGEGLYMIPACAAVGIIGKLWPEPPVLGTLGDWGDRTTRAYLVGAPPVLALQFILGASRPDEKVYGSQWRPFQDTNSVSGHAFISAVPFLTAARMTDNLFLKAGFIVVSTFTGWSRINDNRHYFSQVALGWWMGFVATEAIERTQLGASRLVIVPVASPQMTGAMVMYRW